MINTLDRYKHIFDRTSLVAAKEFKKVRPRDSETPYQGSGEDYAWRRIKLLPEGWMCPYSDHPDEAQAWMKRHIEFYKSGTSKTARTDWQRAIEVY